MYSGGTRRQGVFRKRPTYPATKMVPLSAMFRKVIGLPPTLFYYYKIASMGKF